MRTECKDCGGMKWEGEPCMSCAAQAQFRAEQAQLKKKAEERVERIRPALEAAKRLMAWHDINVQQGKDAIEELVKHPYGSVHVSEGDILHDQDAKTMAAFILRSEERGEIWP
jgi:transcriptional regulator